MGIRRDHARDHAATVREDSTRPAAQRPSGAGGTGADERTRAVLALVSAAGWLCILLWIRTDSPWLLAAAAAGVSVLAFARARLRWRASAVLLTAATIAGYVSISGERRFSSGWEEHQRQRQAQVDRVVGAELDSLAQRGDAAARRASAAASAAPSLAVLHDSLRLVLARSGATAVAVFGGDERLRTWAGSHHGNLPNEILDGRSRHFSGSALFSYLYFAAPVSGGGTAVVASLMRSDLPEPFSAGLGDFASRMMERTGERVLVFPGDAPDEQGAEASEAAGAAVGATWSVALRGPTEQRAAHVRFWKRAVAVLAALAWLVQWVGGPPPRARYALLLPLAAAALLPLEHFFFPPYLTDLAMFRLPGPVQLTLGRVLALSCALIPVVVRAAPLWSRALGPWAAPLVVAATFPLTLAWLRAGASTDLLGMSDTPWIVFLTVLALLPAVATAATLGGGAQPRRTTEEGAGRPVLAALGIAAAVALSLTFASGARMGLYPTPALAALWALPALLVALGIAGSRPDSYARWFCAVALASTAVLPFAWSMRTEARKSLAERRLGLLGVVADPGIDRVLHRVAEQVDSLDRSDAEDLEALYRAWTASGLAAQGVPVLLTLWSPDGVPVHELKLGPTGDRPAWVGELAPALRASGLRRYHPPHSIHGSHVVSAPLTGGRLFTATVPPRRTIPPPSALGPLFASMEGGADPDFLTLVRLEGEPPRAPPTVEWRRNDEGWRAETVVQYPDGPYSVFHVISIPNYWVMLGRAVLVLAPTFGIVSLLWLLSARSVGFLAPPWSGSWVQVASRHGFATSFRFRVTVTLFGFFLLSAVLFWVLANTSLTGAAERTATTLAERVVNQIAQAYSEEDGSMESLARRVGADLLEYRAGELAGSSVDELVELGLYETWVDPEILDALERGQQLAAAKVTSLGDWRYVLAYRRLPDGEIVAAPVPLRAGAAALRRRDVADLLLAALVLSPVLSLVLAFFVGRALARPLNELRVASDRVGGGNLAVGLPEDRVDEFGAVFAAFNRMVLRLDETRQELVRTTRRTRAIVEEVATGVVAVNSAGKITVVNPQAQSLLKVPLEPGDALPREGRSGEVGAWLDELLRPSTEQSAARVFEWGDRRVRGRAKRIAHEGHPGGVVVNLEDVTDELRSERILAWGEMAQQAAHEMRNPLTPISLSVDHLRRAWNDRRPDFGRILETNVQVVLKEIDRLAAIARGFLRLASPGAGSEGPVESVDSGAVAREVLDLYQGGGEMRIHVEAGLPQVMCRDDELKEVLLNLVENSRAAMPGGGTIRISAEEGDGAGSRTTILVEDEGSGIPPALLPRIFEPKFSTRSTGTGLGLPIVRRLVESWGGSVEVESQVGKGTRVRILLRRG